jgi:hypothetical protein
MARNSSAATPCLAHNNNKNTSMKPTIHATHTLLSMAVAVGISSQLDIDENRLILSYTWTLL